MTKNNHIEKPREEPNKHNEQNESGSREEQLIEERIEKMNKMVGMDIDPFGHRFERTHFASDIFEKHSDIETGQKLEKEKVVIAGRIRSLRKHGKIAFAHIEDFSSRIQICIEQKTVGDKRFSLLDNLNVGDFVGVHGYVFKTLKGELSVWVEKYDLLCKSLRPLPDEWFGLKDVESRYRQRYVDMIMNPKVRETFVIRSKILSVMREFLNEKGFIEIVTPILQPIYGGALAEPFTTYHNELKRNLYLRISPELYLKRAIVGGFEKVYEIGRNFRNEGIDTKHNPEFTMLELYWAYADYKDNMRLTEELFAFIAKKIFGTTKIKYQGVEIDFTPPWTRITMHDAIKKYVGIDVNKKSVEELKEVATENGISIPEYADKGIIIEKLFGLVEEKLIQPTFITDYPVEMSPLAKTKHSDPKLTERYELIICGQEFANAYSEENNPIEQKKKFEAQQKFKQAGEKEAHPMDEDFVRALEFGMPPTSGNGIGIDRLVMLLTDSASIRDVIMFPILKSSEHHEN